MNDIAKVPAARALEGGGDIVAIVPQNFEDIQRVARAIVAGGMAPTSLYKLKTPAEKEAAVAIIIMTGLELSLKPMAAMRSLTVINGRPVAYGDGKIAIVRMSKRAKKIDMGTIERDGMLVGYCEAVRADTGESKRVEFTQGEAQQAGLWDTRPTAPKKEWVNGQSTMVMAPNESPWFRYPQRMIMWRAAGYCLGDLFSDVLFGLADEFDIPAETIDADYSIDAPVAKIGSELPPAPPPPKDDVIDVEASEVPDGSLTDLLQQIDDDMATAADIESIEQIWADADADVAFAADADMAAMARRVKERHQARVAPAVADPAGRGDGASHAAPDVAENENSAADEDADKPDAGKGHESPAPAKDRDEPTSSPAVADEAAGGPPPPPAAGKSTGNSLSDDEATRLRSFTERLVTVIGDRTEIVTAESRLLAGEFSLPPGGLLRDKAISVLSLCQRACGNYSKPDTLPIDSALRMIEGVSGVDAETLAAAYKRGR